MQAVLRIAFYPMNLYHRIRRKLKNHMARFLFGLVVICTVIGIVSSKSGVVGMFILCMYLIAYNLYEGA